MWQIEVRLWSPLTDKKVVKPCKQDEGNYNFIFETSILLHHRRIKRKDRQMDPTRSAFTPPLVGNNNYSKYRVIWVSIVFNEKYQNTPCLLGVFRTILYFVGTVLNISIDLSGLHFQVIHPTMAIALGGEGPQSKLKFGFCILFLNYFHP